MNDWNIGHIAEHGVTPKEPEAVIRAARRPYPRREGPRQYRVRGRTAGGYCLQVIFILDEDGPVYLIHARPPTDAEKRQLRRGLR